MDYAPGPSELIMGEYVPLRSILQLILGIVPTREPNILLIDPHLGQVSPLDINRFHLIFRVVDSFSIRSEGEYPQLFLLPSMLMLL
jgi:hypothetical protein